VALIAEVSSDISKEAEHVASISDPDPVRGDRR
jgi:hypothetical protein